MMEWATVELAKVADLTGGHAFKSSEYSATGMAVLRTLNIRDDCSVDLSDPKYIPHDLVPAYERFALQKDDTLFVMVGATLGKVGLIRAKNLPALLNQNMWRIRAKPGKVDPMYLHYCFRHFCIGPLEWMSGSARGFVRRDDYRTLEIPLPSRSEQQQIAAILGALDDKIELNRRMSATSEEMARALYRSWFVDFDPVHARALGQSPAHMAPTTAALFPDSFGPDGLPKGWEFVELGKYCIQAKTTVKPMQQAEQMFQHFSLPAFDTGQEAPFEAGASIRSNKVFVPENAILFSRLNPRIPRVWWAKTAPDKATPVCSTEFFVAQADNTNTVPHLYCLLSSSEFLEAALARVGGTSGSHQRVSPDSLKGIEVVLPPSAVVDMFGETTFGWFNKIHLMTKENANLAALRDTLLPRLMSGDLRIREAEKQIEEVV